MHIKAVISATSREEADEIADMLLEDNLVAGTMIFSGDSRYHWDDEIQENRYWRVQGHTLEKHKKRITERVEQMHEDEVPVIEYTEIDGNRKFLDWIEKNTG